MKKLFLGAIGVAVLSGCGTNMPPQKTGKADEYVINRDDKTPFGNLPSLKRAVASDAASFCTSMGKKVIEKYSIDKERAIMVWPETTLYYECKEDAQAQGVNSPQARPTSESQRPNKIYDELLKLDELRKKGIITDAEFESEKKMLLNRH